MVERDGQNHLFCDVLGSTAGKIQSQNFANHQMPF